MLPAAPASIRTIRVLLFASYAELLGCEVVELSLEGPATVGDALEQLRKLPGAKGLPLRPLCAVNLTQASTDRPLSDGDELALLPPMSGG